MQLGDIIHGNRVNEIHMFGGERLSYTAGGSIYYQIPVLEKHITEVKEVIEVWKKRVKSAISKKESGNAKSHVDFNVGLLAKETETLPTLKKGK